MVAIVVKDLEGAKAEFSKALRIPVDAWKVGDTAADELVYIEGAKPQPARLRYAEAASGRTTYQLVQPVSGDTLWHRSLAQGQTVSSLGYFVRDLASHVELMAKSGAVQIAHGSGAQEGQRYSFAFMQLPVSGLLIELVGPYP